jgi:MSHA biogenesis protein MshO
MQQRLLQTGFTLIEIIMVIVIMGVIGGTVAMFMAKPVGAYFDTGRRATLTDIADTAVRRMSRDIGRALPNSIRNASSQCIEFIPTRTGGRYRASADAGVTGDQSAAVLDFTVADTSFNMLARNSNLPSNQQIQAGDVIAIYNLGISGADAYAGDNTAVVSGVASGAETTITIAAKQFPFASGNNRFQVIPGDEKIVAYVCSGGSLLRSSNYPYTNSCPTTASTATVAVLATNVAACNFVASASDQQRNALVQLTLTLTDASSESVSLYHEVHVNNTP